MKNQKLNKNIDTLNNNTFLFDTEDYGEPVKALEGHSHFIQDVFCRSTLNFLPNPKNQESFDENKVNINSKKNIDHLVIKKNKNNNHNQTYLKKSISFFYQKEFIRHKKNPLIKKDHHKKNNFYT